MITTQINDCLVFPSEEKKSKLFLLCFVYKIVSVVFQFSKKTLKNQLFRCVHILIGRYYSHLSIVDDPNFFFKYMISRLEFHNTNLLSITVQIC